MRNLLLVLFLFGILTCQAQVQILIHSMGTGGGAVTTVTGGSTVNGFVNLGQPMVLPRTSATSNGSGVMVANNAMFTSSTIDSDPPDINSVAALNLIKNSDASFSSNISDNFQTSLSATLFYRPISGGTFSSIPLNKSGTSFTTTITSDFYDNNGYDDVGMEYYIEASDANATVRHPASGSLYTYLTNPNAQVSASLLVYGDKTKHYRIISIPFSIDGAVTDVFTDLPDLDKKKYRLWEYDNETKEWTEYADFNTIQRGRGYFIIMNSDISTVKLKLGSRKAEVNNRSSLATLYDLTLQPGWNLIGNPYPVPIGWSDVLTLNSNPAGVATELKVWGGSSDAGSYSNLSGGELAAYQGAFVLNSGSSPVTLNIPFLGQTAVGGRVQQEVFTSNLAESKWRLPLELRQGGNEYLMGALGMHPDANVSVDQFDDFNPPSFVESIQIDFSHPEHAWGDFARDMVATTGSYIWRFKVKANLTEDASVAWDNTKFGDNDIELFLYDVKTNTIVDMRQENHYKFSPAQSKEFKIYYGHDLRERIGPDEVKVDNPYPNPFSSKEPVKFTVGLPDNLVTSYAVEMTIRNAVGLQVHTQKKNLSPGLHTLSWSGRKGDNELQPAGFYFYTIKVGQQNFTGKVILTNQND